LTANYQITQLLDYPLLNYPITQLSNYSILLSPERQPARQRVG